MNQFNQPRFQNQNQMNRHLQGGRNVGYAPEVSMMANDTMPFANNGGMVPANQCAPVVPGSTLEQAICAANSNLSMCDIWTFDRMRAEGALCKFPPDVKQAIDDHAKLLYSHTLYSVAKVEASTKFLLASNKKEIGLRNIDADKIEMHHDFLAVRARIGTAVVTPAVGAVATAADIAAANFFQVEDTNLALGTTKLIRSALAEEIKNAELTIRLKTGVIFIQDLPLSVFDNFGEHGKVGEIELQTPFVLPNSEIVEWFITLPTGATITTNLYVRMELIGFEARK